MASTSSRWPSWKALRMPPAKTSGWECEWMLGEIMWIWYDYKVWYNMMYSKHVSINGLVLSEKSKPESTFLVSWKMGWYPVCSFPTKPIRWVDLRTFRSNPLWHIGDPDCPPAAENEKESLPFFSPWPCFLMWKRHAHAHTHTHTIYIYIHI